MKSLMREPLLSIGFLLLLGVASCARQEQAAAPQEPPPVVATAPAPPPPPPPPEPPKRPPPLQKAGASAPPIFHADSIQMSAHADPNYAVEKVYFGTDRKQGPATAKGVSFNGERSDTQTFGECEVSIPRDHRMGDLEAPSVWRLEFHADPEKHVVLLNTNVLGSDAFYSIISKAQPKASDSILVFVHGYNVTFEDAARRTAQITYDLGFPGLALFYSWPSRGVTAEYTFDEGSIEWAQSDIEAFLENLLTKSRSTTKVYVIGHSMGNRGLTRALADLVVRKPNLAPRLSEIILTAPDIDAGVFQREIMPPLIATGRPITLYASSTDEALRASKLVHDEARAGEAGQALIIMKGMETVDASAVDTSLLGHSYFADTRSVMSDMFDLIEHDVPDAQRFGLESMHRNQNTYWRFKP